MHATASLTLSILYIVILYIKICLPFAKDFSSSEVPRDISVKGEGITTYM